MELLDLSSEILALVFEHLIADVEYISTGLKVRHVCHIFDVQILDAISRTNYTSQYESKIRTRIKLAQDHATLDRARLDSAWLFEWRPHRVNFHYDLKSLKLLPSTSLLHRTVNYFRSWRRLIALVLATGVFTITDIYSCVNAWAWPEAGRPCGSRQLFSSAVTENDVHAMCFALACFHGRLALITEWLATRPGCNTLESVWIGPPLALAVAAGRADVVATLLDIETPLESIYWPVQDVLRQALQRPDQDVATAILDHFAVNHSHDGAGDKLVNDNIAFALKSGDVSTVKFLFDHGPKRTGMSLKTQQMILVVASYSVDTEYVVWWLYEQYPQLNPNFECRLPHLADSVPPMSPLAAAAHHGLYDVVTFLLKKGALQSATITDPTPFFRACMQNHKKIAELLLSHDKTVAEDRMFTAQGDLLEIAVQRGHFEIVKLLLDAGIARFEKSTGHDRLALAIGDARKGRRTQILNLLLKHYKATLSTKGPSRSISLK